jgi:hypothetical protein
MHGRRLLVNQGSRVAARAPTLKKRIFAAAATLISRLCLLEALSDVL